MILTKRRLIVFSVALGVFLLLLKVSVSFFDDSPTRSSGELEQAVRELLEEADRGSAQAHYRLGRFFEEGLGVPRNLAKAHAWYTLAAAQGMLEASMARDAVAREMTREQLAEAYRLAIEWSSVGETDNSVAGAAPNPIRGTINEDADAALSDGDATMVSNHLTAGLDPDSVDSNGETLLNRAVESGNIAVIEAVLDAGADINAAGKAGKRPLGIAAAAGREDVVALLIERGADATLADPTLADPTLADSGAKHASAPKTDGGEPVGSASSGTDSGISKPQPDVDDFETAAGHEDTAGAEALDTASRRQISRDLLGATVGDGTPVAVTTPEKTSQQASRRSAAPRMAAPAGRIEERAVAPPVSKKIQQARIEPGKAPTARPRSLEPGRKASDRAWSPPAPEIRVKTAQYLLARLGYDPGPADGVAGPKTRAAVRAYRKDNGERADGRVTKALVDRLDAEVVAEETRRLAEGDAKRDKEAALTRRRQDIGVLANFLGGVQKLLGYEFNSTKDPDKMNAYCSKNFDNWIYDFGTERFVLCRDLVGGKATVSR